MRFSAKLFLFAALLPVGGQAVEAETFQLQAHASRGVPVGAALLPLQARSPRSGPADMPLLVLQAHAARPEAQMPWPLQGHSARGGDLAQWDGVTQTAAIP